VRAIELRLKAEGRSKEPECRGHLAETPHSGAIFDSLCSATLDWLAADARGVGSVVSSAFLIEQVAQLQALAAARKELDFTEDSRPSALAGSYHW